jgi:hypothetical protein
MNIHESQLRWREQLHGALRAQLASGQNCIPQTAGEPPTAGDGFSIELLASSSDDSRTARDNIFVVPVIK